jgi:hypothetical protein
VSGRARFTTGGLAASIRASLLQDYRGADHDLLARRAEYALWLLHRPDLEPGRELFEGPVTSLTLHAERDDAPGVPRYLRSVDDALTLAAGLPDAPQRAVAALARAVEDTHLHLVDARVGGQGWRVQDLVARYAAAALLRGLPARTLEVPDHRAAAGAETAQRG